MKKRGRSMIIPNGSGGSRYRGRCVRLREEMICSGHIGEEVQVIDTVEVSPSWTGSGLKTVSAILKIKSYFMAVRELHVAKLVVWCQELSTLSANRLNENGGHLRTRNDIA